MNKMCSVNKNACVKANNGQMENPLGMLTSVTSPGNLAYTRRGNASNVYLFHRFCDIAMNCEIGIAGR